jgi:hypothetical protein
MPALEELFDEYIPLEDGGHADAVSSNKAKQQEPTGDMESKGFNTTRQHPYDPTHRTPYQTSESRRDRIGRRRCFVNGRISKCDEMPNRGLSGIASLKKIKSLREKYGRG